MARQAGGRVLLRIEDIDSPRVKQAATDEAISDLRWLGLDWDDEPIVQTQRLQLYEQAFQQLQAQEYVYPCTCSRNDVAEAASAPHAEGDEPPYPGTCAGRSVADAASLGDRPFAWRFSVTDSPSFIDGFRGMVEVDLHRKGGDFVVWKSSGTPAYQLAVVVDDAAQGITDVIRGDDLVSSTPRQLLLYRQLGLHAPRFLHVPLVVGPDGRRLAKRHGDTRLTSMREAGVGAEALIGLLAWSCGWLERPKLTTSRELISIFDLKTIPSHPFVLESQHLAAIGYKS